MCVCVCVCVCVCACVCVCVYVCMCVFCIGLYASGIIWPLEAMPVWMRYLGYCLPNTYAAQAMRSILARGESPPYLARRMRDLVIV